MELRSSRVLKRGKPKITSILENQDSSDGKRLSLSSDKSNSGRKGGSEAEIGVCVDGCDENHEMCMKETLNTDDKGLFLGSEVLDPIKDLGVSCPKEEESVERAQVEEGNGSMSVNLSETGSGFREEIKSPHVDFENGSEDIKSEACAAAAAAADDDDDDDDDGKETLFNDDPKKAKGNKEKDRCRRKKKNARNLKKNIVIGLNGDDGECMPKHKRGTKRKNMEGSGSKSNEDTRAKKGKVEKGGVHVRGRVVRSKTMTAGCGSEATVDDGRIKVVLGLKRADEIPKEVLQRFGRPRKVETQDENIRPKKKRKKHGKPRKFQGEITSLPVVEKDESLIDIPKKKLERRGRPRKLQGKLTPLPMVEKDESLIDIPKKKLERRGRPRKLQGKLTPLPVVEKDESLIEIPRKKLERRGRPRKLTPLPVVEKDESSIDIPRKKLERRGRPRKPQDTNIPLPMVKEDGNLIEVQRKKLERRGRPRKLSNERPVGPMKSRQKLYGKNVIFKKLKCHGKPPKMEARALATQVMKTRTAKLVAVKKSSKICKKDVFSDVTLVKSEGNREEMMVELEGEGNHAGKGIFVEKMDRRMLKQLVRDKIANILLKSGWTIDRKLRQEKSYEDSVYVEPNRRKKHWSITRAYASLKRKIEDGGADNNEISAFAPIPEEEISMLFKKKRCSKKKKNKKIGKKVNKGKIVTDKKKQVVKKSKGGSKRKLIMKQKRNGVITKSRKPSLLARDTDKGLKEDYDGILVNKKRNLLSWMIDSGVILVGCKVRFGKTRRQNKSSEGTITNEGICCCCCNKTRGLSEFVSHCGGKISQCFDNIYLESGICLRKCLMESWRKEEESNLNRFNVVDVQGDDPNDDTCNICGDGGNLICCDGCPSTFHQSCLDIQNFPSGDWNCIYCSCKFCGVVSINTPQVEETHDEITSQMLSCRLCEVKFHQLCLQEVVAVDTDSNRSPFCGSKCQELFERLQKHLGVKYELENGFSWTLLQRSDVDQESTHHDTQLKIEHNSKLAVAFSVMDECFVPILDDRSGINIIHNVVYNCGSNFKRLNYSGFLTAVLEKDDEFITAASIRIHGYRSAEMPFIGTRHMYRRQGMCRRLLDAIESTLSSLGVEELIIPAIPTLLQTWTKVFGFMPIEESKKQAMKCMSMMVFPGIDMLKKPLLQNQSAHMDHTPSSETGPSNAIDYKGLLDAAEAEKDVTDHEKKKETASSMDICSCPKPNNNPEPNNENNLQFETTSSHATDYKQTKESIVGKDAIAYEQTEETVLGGNVIDASGVEKDVIDYKDTEKETVLMDSCSCPNLENETLASSHAADSQTSVDLNFPVENVLPCYADGRASVDSASFPELSSIDSLISGNCQSSELKLEVENGGVPGVEVKVNPSLLTSNLVMKNTFDLNVRPTAVETDIHIISGDSVQCERQTPVNLTPEPVKVNLS